MKKSFSTRIRLAVAAVHRLRRAIGDQRGSIGGDMVGMAIFVALGVAVATLASAAWHAQTALHNVAVASAAVNDSAFRFVRDARAAKAIDVLPQDAAGNDNSDGHEFALLYQNVDGSLRLIRYTYTASSRSWARCVQSTPGEACAQDGMPMSGISVMTAAIITAPELVDPSSPYYTPVLSSDPAHAPIDVELATQWAGMRAGNHIVEVRIANAKQDLTVDLMPGSYVTSDLTEISGTYTPPPANTCTYVASYSGSSSTGWTPINGSALWQWFQPPASCANAPTPPPTAYVQSYSPSCPSQFYVQQTNTATWQQQPQPDATTPPPTTVVVSYNSDGSKNFGTFAWNQGPCPNPTQPPQQPQFQQQNVCNVPGDPNYDSRAGQTIGVIQYVGTSAVPPCNGHVPCTARACRAVEAIYVGGGGVDQSFNSSAVLLEDGTELLAGGYVAASDVSYWRGAYPAYTILPGTNCVQYGSEGASTTNPIDSYPPLSNVTINGVVVPFAGTGPGVPAQPWFSPDAANAHPDYVNSVNGFYALANQTASNDFESTSIAGFQTWQWWQDELCDP
jgi:hypothetical protein